METQAQTSSKGLHKTRQTHFSRTKKAATGKEAACQKCGRKFNPTRKWQSYCSSKCRKLAWLRKEAKIEILDDHEARLRAIEAKIGIKKGK